MPKRGVRVFSSPKRERASQRERKRKSGNRACVRLSVCVCYDVIFLRRDVVTLDCM